MESVGRSLVMAKNTNNYLKPNYLKLITIFYDSYLFFIRYNINLKKQL